MTFLIHRLSSDMPLPAPPNAGQATLRIVKEVEGVNGRYTATIVARTEEPNPVNPAKGIHRAQCHTENFLTADGEQEVGSLIKLLGFSVLSVLNKNPEPQEESNIITPFDE
jgi:hypothetical protein